MINKRELRLGNLLRCQYSNDIDVIDVGYMVDVLRGGIDLETDVEPIPLTEEWLLRGGFEKHQWKNELWFSVENLAIEKTEGGFFDRETGTKIDSLHWLQNYTFFKTGQELEFTES